MVISFLVTPSHCSSSTSTARDSGGAWSRSSRGNVYRKGARRLRDEDKRGDTGVARKTTMVVSKEEIHHEAKRHNDAGHRAVAPRGLWWPGDVVGVAHHPRAAGGCAGAGAGRGHDPVSDHRRPRYVDCHTADD